MNDQVVEEMAQFLFASRPGTREEAADKFMFIVLTPAELDAFYTEGRTDLSCRLLFRELKDNASPLFAHQVAFVQSQPGSCIVVVAERTSEDDNHMKCLYTIVVS